MQAEDRLRLLKYGLYGDNPGFKRWWIQLKRCYPWPESVLADLLHTDVRQIWRIRNGKCRATKKLMGILGYVIGFRIGIFDSARDLLRIRRLMATGELERMIDVFLAKEAANIAAGKARAEARKRAKLSGSCQEKQPASAKPIETQPKTGETV